jgi:FkbM family methyltransferase
MQKKLRGLFLNTETAICSIYESGKMCFDYLVQSESYSLDYVELSSDNRDISLGYDFYIFNYHFVQMKWLDTKYIKKIPGFKATIVLEMSQNSPFDCVSKDDFDAYLVLDPTCKHFLRNVYAFPRPLDVNLPPLVEFKEAEIPVIGTFGLSFGDKGFDEVVKAVNKEFDAAIVRINVPNFGNVDTFKSMLAGLDVKKEIKVELTDHYFSKKELITWCAQNTLNVFLYNRRIGNGLSATTDQAIASGRPLAISTNPTFRHIHSYIKPYPYLSLKEAIKTTIPIVKRIQEDWSSRSFVSHFENVLKENNIQACELGAISKMKLPIVNRVSRIARKLFTKQGLRYFIPPILLIARRRLINRSNVSKLQPFVHQSLLSSSQFHEDLIIDLLLGGKNEGTYVDIGANDPFYNSNTRRFYLKGWRGINIEPGEAEFKKIKESREFDINLNMAISNNTGNLTFYKIGNDSSLSTLDHSTAVTMAETYKSKVTSSTVDVMPISKVLDIHLDGRHIDFMSVDAEGHDLDVLISNDWDNYRPTIVIVECNTNSSKIIMFMEQNSYLYIFSNHVNALFVDKMTKDQDVLSSIFWNDFSL